ncbi:hypothetical protein [Sporomusa termitida]|uniref:Uncharacterized protein n=1 Tax=Sporomusa termitida TaxID=2377 RepID=A0A517DYE7_9FIRM|nr:hypothetical protein [Sporomusa termitida]QDR82377.1 hypothetical protein SPTER_38020 [Sporomusa termitida]
MSACVQPIDSLLAECKRDIRWEFHQIYLRIRPEEVQRLAEGLLHKTPPEWPRALYELQKGKLHSRLLKHLNFHLRRQGFPAETELVFRGPFPSFSLRPLQAVIEEHRTTLRMAGCIEFLGNKIWDHALKPVRKRLMPVHVHVATWALDACGCSAKQQWSVVLADLTQRIRGSIINFLFACEALLIEQVQEQLLLYKTNLPLPISEAAV